MKIKTRIAPSPTGSLHLGTARTALFNWLFAHQQSGGEFILRLDDTDRFRSKPEFEKDIIEGLKWLGLDWDGSIVKQSERFKMYREYAEKLVETGKAEDESKNKIRENWLIQIGNRDTSVRNKAIILKNPTEPIEFEDVVRGKIKFEADALKDEVLIKSDGSPTYNFATAVDDIEDEISHVIRGEDHVSNTPKQIYIQDLLIKHKITRKTKKPQYAHLPLILNPDMSKLSKRSLGSSDPREIKPILTIEPSILNYRSQGFLSDALVNYMALLGWNPGTEQEIFTLEDLKEKFNIKQVQKGGAIFDVTKLLWINQAHIKRMAPEDLKELLLEFYPNKKDLITDGFIRLVHPRIKTLKEARVDFRWFEQPKYDDEFKRIITWGNQHLEETLVALRDSLDFIKELKDEDTTNRLTLDNKIKKELTGKYRRLGVILHPLRIALSGEKNSPSPLELIDLLGKEESLTRIKEAIKVIS